ncbi:MAG TPA: VOC family protein [Thermoanaerobaculia bacterium]|jgi:catechol 2,3-dioxygenase-like lactoylglutathione lyase family enzyme|nr:VOC family protein [Thermoanaerobaculia bacterium]
MRSKRIVGLAMCSLLALTSGAAADGLGVGRGVDHVGMLVRLENFAAAADVLTRQLGFSATPVLTSPAGVENRLIWFDDLSYLELDAFTADNAGTAPFLAFLANHEGAKFYGTQVLDATQAVAFLDAAGYPNVGPIPAGPLTIQSTGQVVGLTPLWTEIILTQVVAPDNSTFFLDYDEAQVQQLFLDVPALAPRPHPNTAQRIDTLWLVVSDLDTAIAFYTGLGLQVEARNERIDYLGARSTRVRMHNATLALLQPDGPGLAADFAADRGEGILGVSVAVRDLDAAHRLVEGNTMLTLPIFRFHGRDRFLIPASLPHGVLIEMVE